MQAVMQAAAAATAKAAAARAAAARAATANKAVAARAAAARAARARARAAAARAARARAAAARAARAAAAAKEARMAATLRCYLMGGSGGAGGHNGVIEVLFKVRTRQSFTPHADHERLSVARLRSQRVRTVMADTEVTASNQHVA